LTPKWLSRCWSNKGQRELVPAKDPNLITEGNAREIGTTYESTKDHL